MDDLKFIITDVTKTLLSEVSVEVQRLTNIVSELKSENAELRNEIKVIREVTNSKAKEMTRLEDQIKRRNVIIKGLPSSNAPNEAVKNLCTSTLNIDPNAVRIKSVRKIFDRNSKMGVIAELDSEEEVYQILRNTNKLTGSQISIEKDLNNVKQEQKKVMLQLKKEITQADRSHRLTVRDERLRIGDNWFYWNQNQELACGRGEGVAQMEQIYGKRFDHVDFNYRSLLSKVNTNLNRNRY